jgi:TRAP-type C4-dicarboxylate transport system permease small subunit
MVKLLSSAATILAMAVIALMAMLTVADVFMRYALSQPITGTTEITEYLMVCALLGMIPCALEKRHIKVDAVSQHVPPKVRVTIDIITLLAGMGLIAILAWQGFCAGLEALKYDARSSGLSVPTFPFYVVLSLSFAILFLVMGSLLIQKAKELLK